MSTHTIHPASYRDPSGFVFVQEGIIYRQVNTIYTEDYDLLISSGLYRQLTEKKWLIDHEEIPNASPGQGTYKILRPRQIDFINYPYEWCFSQLKEAALLTLRIQQLSMTYGMSLKDATPFNIVFEGSSPVFIDSLSFEKYDASKPWVAYRQFCESFLAPLLLAAYHHPDLTRIMLTYPDGIPLEICASLLPFSSRFKSLASLHIHLQAGIKGSAKSEPARAQGFSADKLNRIITHLVSGIGSLQLNKKLTTWSDYYTNTILQDNYLQEKEKIVSLFIDQTESATAIDLGSNTGQFALLMEKKGKKVIALDIDPLCIERLFLHTHERHQHITSLVSDLMHPAPSTGWANAERISLLQRLNADIILALALVHHLCIGRNLPFAKLAETISRLGTYLVIEFVPKEDEKVKQLLSHRKDIFTTYDLPHFLQAFEQYFQVLDSKEIGNSSRTVFLMKKKND
jgi:ribosomal protein L11 methylase PrmA